MQCLELIKQIKKLIKGVNMQEINNLIYKIEIKFINNSGIKSTVSMELHDNGLKVKVLKVGDVCVTEEKINGRVLSGRIDNTDGYSGYRYDYKNGENLLNINPTVPISSSTSLINSTKMKSDFISADLVLSSILRNDYRVVILNKGDLNIIKTVSSKNKGLGKCSVQERINLLKLDGEESFIEKSKKRVYKIGGKVIDESQALSDGDIQSQINIFSQILNKNLQTNKELIELTDKIKAQHMLVGGEKTL